MIEHDSPKDALDWLSERRRETRDWRLSLQEYTARMQAQYLGMQWRDKLPRGSIMGKVAEGVENYLNQSRRNGPEPLRVTLNKLTQNTISVIASSNPRKLDVHATPSAGIGRPGDLPQQDVAEAVANAVIEDSGATSVIRRANAERAVDGMHGFGHRIEVTNQNGVMDMRQKCFNFYGYQLTLDPTETDQDLSKHEYVIHSEVMTLHAAMRVFGADNLRGINEANLPMVGQLMSIETGYNRLSSGAMFPESASMARAKGLVVHTTFLRGPSKRFDRMYVVVDGQHEPSNRDGGRTLINWANNADGHGNPYGGVGMPLFCLYGYFRPGGINGISDVAMQVDSQEKLNITASIYFQSMWNYMQKAIVVDPRGLSDAKMTPGQFMRQMQETGVVFWSPRDRGAQQPRSIEFPQPPQSIGNDIERFSRDVRQSTFRTDSHVGENKSHVSDRTVERSVEKSEIASEDRVDSDVGEYERFIESLASTQIRITQSNPTPPTAIRLADEAGLSDEQLGALFTIDALRQLPRFKISEEAIRRRSRSQKKQDLLLLIESGAMAADPTEMRRIFAEMDMPASEQDRIMIQYANLTAAKVANGEPYQASSLGIHASYMIEAFQRAIAQTRDPQARQLLDLAIQSQREAEMGGNSPQQAEPTIDDAVSAAFNPQAVRA